MLVISVDNRPYKVLWVLEYYANGRVLIQTEYGPFMAFFNELYVM